MSAEEFKDRVETAADLDSATLSAMGLISEPTKQGGVGKTTTLHHLARSLHSEGSGA